jgi:murein DD-endopeptidase MepM/ murein hydrolase activator NlpD
MVVAPIGSADSNGGGVGYVAPPKVATVKCVTDCVKKGVRGGGLLKVGGNGLSGVTKVIFTGGRGTRDDIAVDVKPDSDKAIKLAVPMAAQSGPLMVWAGAHSKAKSKALKIAPPLPPIKSATLTASAGPSDPGAPTLETGTSLTKYFLGSRGGVSFQYRVGSAAPVNAVITLTRQADGAVVQTWNATAVAPNAIQTIRWNGLAGGEPATEARYGFTLAVTDAAGKVARSAGVANPQRDAFDLHLHEFPLRAKHTYGDGFGAGRSGHSHQGQDVMAGCGSKLVAARGGTVKSSKFEGAAGNYVVIDGANDDIDYVYMHLRDPSPLKEGDKVYTGQQIGVVGQTGDASACHLHFEEWSAPGWYSGGSAFDPTPDLQAWDAFS